VNAATATADAVIRPETLAGIGDLMRFALRRDRVRIPVWALSIGGLVGYFGAVIPVVYPDQESMQSRAAIMMEPSGAMMTGPGYGLEHYTFGVMIANEMLGMLAIASALMSIFLVVRHTRTEEETGRAEMVRANVVGRHSQLTAALADVLVANTAVVLLLLAALVGNDLGATDSFAAAAGVGLVGLVFGAVAAVTAQLTEHARSAAGIAGSVLGLAYVLRGVGDAQERGGSTLSWLSPIGWAQQTRAFVDLRWWPLLLCVALAAVLIPVAYALAARRDVGAGMMPARRGRPDATTALLNPIGLAFRTERGSLYGWAAGLAVFGLLTGSMGEGIVTSFEAQPQLAEVFGAATEGDILRMTMAAMLAFFAMGVAVYAVISVNRLRREEDEGRTGAVLGTSIGRPAWAGGSLAVTALNSALLLVVSGLTLGVGLGASIGEVGLAWDFTVAALAYLPITLAFAGVALVAYGAGRGGVWWVWLLVVASILVGLYGPLLNLPDAVLDAAPFGLVPRVPAEAFDAAPVVGISLVALALGGAGLALFRRRDLSA
jgi:ABC-2 type transport system permease protein